jgi:hypothetical protein
MDAEYRPEIAILQAWELAAKVAPVLVGVVFGSVAIGSACVVWARKHVFGFAGFDAKLRGAVFHQCQRRLYTFAHYFARVDLSGSAILFRVCATLR